MKKLENKSFIAKIRNYFLTGIVVIIPIGITLYLTIIIIGLSSSLIPASINPNQYLPFNIPGLELLIAFFIITIIGMISLTFLGRTFLNYGQKILDRIPILRSVYNGLGQLTKTFSNSNNKSKKIVLVEYPRQGIWSVGFATNETSGEIALKTKNKLVNVFIPTTPNPTSGFLILIPKKDVIYLNMSFEEASKFIMSAGSINPISK